MARPGLNTERVVAAAADLADEIGFDAVTVSVLARHLDLRTPSLYSHVAGSADLRLRVAALALGESADAIIRATQAHPLAPLQAYAHAWRDFAHRHPGRYTATRLAVPRIGDSAQMALAAGRRHAELLLGVVDGFEVPEGDRTHAVRLIGSMVHGYVSLELAGGFDHSEPGPEQSWTYALATIERALTSG